MEAELHVDQHINSAPEFAVSGLKHRQRLELLEECGPIGTSQPSRGLRTFPSQAWGASER